jgi:Mn2+/Fe2+ NRAMP family transporter
MIEKTRRWFRQLGPGLITGAADDDPSGIATYSQAGAQFGYQLAWTVVLTYPLMVGIQMVSARMGRVTGHGLASNIRSHFPRPILYVIVSMLVIANTINIAADIAAMGEALQLIVGGGTHGHAVVFGLFSLTLQVFLPYQRYVRYLKWLTLALLAYVAVVFTIAMPWREVIVGSCGRTFALNAPTLTVIVAVFGTTISPYLFFWQAAQEVEEIKADPAADGAPKRPRMRAVTCAHQDRYLYRNGLFESDRALHHHQHGGDAAMPQASPTSTRRRRPRRRCGHSQAIRRSSLQPGHHRHRIARGAVLAGSAAYAVAEAFEWKSGLDLKLLEAREFYAMIAFATLGGVAIDFTPIDPIKALFFSAVINGVIAVPIMVVMMLLADDPNVMGRFHRHPAAEGAGLVRDVDDGRSGDRDVRDGLAAAACPVRDSSRQQCALRLMMRRAPTRALPIRPLSHCRSDRCRTAIGRCACLSGRCRIADPAAVESGQPLARDSRTATAAASCLRETRETRRLRSRCTRPCRRFRTCG